MRIELRKSLPHHRNANVQPDELNPTSMGPWMGSSPAFRLKLMGRSPPWTISEPFVLHTVKWNASKRKQDSQEWEA